MFGFLKKRTPSPQVTIDARMFAAAEVSRTLAPWIWDGGFSNSEVAGSLATVRNRSRDMAKNSEYFCRWLQLWTANIVGPDGFRLKSFAEKSATDVSVDADAAYNIETHWDRWSGDRRLVDSAQGQNLAGILRLAAENWARDGESFILIDRHAQNRYGISLRVVRPDCIDEQYNDSTGNGATVVRCGVEVERATFRPVAYFFNADSSDTSAAFVGGSRRVRIPAADVLHLFSPHDAQQVRGFPLGHPFLKKLKMLDEFDQAELVAARDEVNTLGVFKAPAGRESEIKNLADSKNRDRLEAKSEPGSRIVLPQGWDYDPKHPNHPNAGLPAFKASMLRDIASGAGVEYANFANDWSGVSYSSVRAGTLAERDQWMTRQAEVIDRVLDPLFEAWLGSFLSLRIRGSYRQADFQRLLPHDFRGRRWQWVDPMKDVNAAAVAVAHGWKTDAEVASDFGGDIDDNIDEAMRIKDAKTAAGLVVDESAAKQINAVEDDDGKEDR